jgi:hypothetical protein
MSSLPNGGKKSYNWKQDFFPLFGGEKTTTLVASLICSFKSFILGSAVIICENPSEQRGMRYCKTNLQNRFVKKQSCEDNKQEVKNQICETKMWKTKMQKTTCEKKMWKQDVKNKDVKQNVKTTIEKQDVKQRYETRYEHKDVKQDVNKMWNKMQNKMRKQRCETRCEKQRFANMRYEKQSEKQDVKARCENEALLWSEESVEKIVFLSECFVSESFGRHSTGKVQHVVATVLTTMALKYNERDDMMRDVKTNTETNNIMRDIAKQMHTETNIIHEDLKYNERYNIIWWERDRYENNNTQTQWERERWKQYTQTQII